MIIYTYIGAIDIEDYLGNESEMYSVSEGFSQHSDSTLIDTIGAIDRWLVCIVRTLIQKDDIQYPISFYPIRDFMASPMSRALLTIVRRACLMI